MQTYIHSDELYHHGIKGQKWGVRRYQNKDGTLTDSGKKRLAKDLKKDYKRNYKSAQPFSTSEKYNNKVKDAVNKHITDDDKKRILDARKNALAKRNEVIKAEQELDSLAEKYGKKAYEAELRKNPTIYDTPRAKQKLYDYCKYEDGYDEARKRRPDLDKASKADRVAWDTYREECRKVTDKILGSYGDTKLYQCKYYSYSIRDSVGDVVRSMDREWNM